MDYEGIYNDLIRRRKSEPATGYTENHHIKPRCMGGTDDPSNLVRLTGREHWVAHLLLYRIHKTPSLAYACNAMAMRCEERGIPEIKNSWMYQKVREEVSKSTSIRNKQRVGMKYARGKGKLPRCDYTYTCNVCGNEFIRNDTKRRDLKYCSRRCSCLGNKPNTSNEEARQKISESLKCLYSNKTHPNKGKLKPKISCPYCSKTGSANNMKRWHFENCKFKPR